MKYKSLLLSLLLLPASLFIQNFSSSPDGTPAPFQGQLSGKISLSGAYALYPMVVRWGEEFQKLHPGVKVDVQGGGAGKGMTDALSGTVSFGMVSREIAPEEVSKGAYAVAVCKDAVIPTINPSNPYLAIIKRKGIAKQQFYKVFITGEITTWGELLGIKSMKPIKLFTRSDAAGAAEHGQNSWETISRKI